MNSNIALKLAPHAVCRSVPAAPARKHARVLPARRGSVRPAGRTATLAPSAAGRVEAVLLSSTFVALAGLAIIMEAVGVASTLLG